MEDLWERFSVYNEQTRRLAFGSTELFVEYLKGLVRVQIASPLEEWCGTRLLSAQLPCTLETRPATPDLPLVLKAAEPFVLLPEATFFSRITVPVWIQLLAHLSHGQRSEPVLDIPTEALPRTWFGTNEVGELAYAMPFEPASETDYSPLKISVPVRITNASGSLLRFERFMLRVIHLDVFLSAGRLVANDVNISFRGADQLSHIVLSETSSLASSFARRITQKRVPANKDFIRKSFMWLRDLTG